MRIAIVKLSALGDIVHAMVALQFIKQHQPDCLIDWIVETRFAEVLQHNPDIHQVLCVNLKALKHDKRLLLQEFKRLRRYAQQSYDVVIDAQGLLKSAIVARLVGKRVVGFDRHSIREALAASLYHQHISCSYAANSIDRNVKVLAGALGLSVTPEQIIAKQPFLYSTPLLPELKRLLHPEQRKVLYVVGSTWPSRNYPKEHLLQVIETLPQQALVIWGNSEELQTAEWLAAHSAKVTVLPKLDLNQLKGLLAAMDLVIGNDTGPTHMAWGLNRPSITLFGPTPISRVYQTPINRVLKSPSEVNPYKLNKQDFSIKDIPPTAVIALAAELLAL